MTALDDLRSCLLQLKPTGPEGFEGLLGVILERIASQPFRLAKSGLQNGKDGETLSTSNHVSFEGKLYTGSLSDKDVLGKIAQLLGNASPPDLWVLGATVEAGTQLVATLQAAAAVGGIATLVLDWPATSSYPPLAVACAMAVEEVGGFLQTQVEDEDAVRRAKSALKTIGELPDLAAHAAAITASVCASSLALANAATANAAWLEEAFSDRARARAVFGQAVSPLADGPMQHRPRSMLTAQIRAELMASPSRRILALVGGEGRGKTWLLAESWLEIEQRPLAIFVSASDLPLVAAFGEFQPFLIGKIIHQTGEDDTDVSRRRWERRLRSWRTEASDGAPRFVLCVDGLNQNPRFDWPRWLDEAAANIEQLGGAIIVTTRKPFFEERLQRSLHTPITWIEVPEWTAQELDEILREREMDPAQLTPAVRDRLRNPRILAIAFELHSNKQIQNFTELSVERLLFEHIRASARDGTAPETPELFAKRLAQHAREILDRVQSQQTEDRLIFDQLSGSGQPHLLTPDLRAVTAEHFFQSVPGDATLYSLSGEGLSLALGLAIVAALRKAERNGHDASEELGKLLEPVASLDMTADAAFSALMAASVDDTCSLALRKALLVGFLGLQNANGDLYPPFVGVVRNAPEAAMKALGELAITSRHVANKEWLSEALREVRDDAYCWGIVSNDADRWLRQYTLDPAIAVFSSIRQEGQEKFEKEKAEKGEKLKGKLAALTDAERAFLTSKMVEVNHDPAPLQQEAFALLAGKPLAPFVEGLVAAAFSMSLNSNFHAPHEEQRALIRFNRQDWQATQAKLFEAASFLFDTPSRTGQWALVELLRAVSRREDGLKAHRLVEELTADREKFAGWRLVEKYCATDPCNPTAERPANIDETAETYADIAVNELLKSRSMGSEDHFLQNARPGMARFAPEVAIAKHREYAASILTRSGAIRRIGISSFDDHSAVLDGATAGKFLKTAAALSSPYDAERQEARENWVSSQVALVAGLAHLDGDAQVEILMALPPHGPPLLKLAEVLKPASPDKLEAELEQALASGDHCRQLMALMVARHSGTHLTTRAREIVGVLGTAQESSVRSLAFNIIALEDDEKLIRAVVERGWSAAKLDPHENKIEVYYGSLVVIAAARLGILAENELLDRIEPELYGYAAKTLGSAVRDGVAARIQAAATRAVEIDLPFVPPIVTQQAADTLDPARLSLAEPEEEDGGMEAFIKRLKETDEEFAARQKAGWENFRAFEASLTQAQARLIVDDLGSSAIDALMAASPEGAAYLASSFLPMEQRKLRQVANFALRLAQGISTDHPELAKQLFERLAGLSGIVRISYGPSSVSLEALMVWRSAPAAELDQLRTARLDQVASDHDISQEVMAALMAGRADFLEQYARTKLQSPVPADNARALMVLGYGLESALAEQQLCLPVEPESLVGMARKAALYAYERNQWARHWYERMAATDSAEEFWRYSVLLTKIVDARFRLWEDDVPRTGSTIESFGWSIEDDVKRRANAWKTHREKTLCGDKVPSRVFSVVDA